MIHAANTATHNMANDDEGFNKEMARDGLGWHVQCPNKKTGAVLLASRVLKVCGLHIG
jgi:hypothetical protein